MWKKVLIGFTISIGVILLIVILIGVLVDVEDNGEAVATDAKPIATVEPTKPAPIVEPTNTVEPTETPEPGLGISAQDIKDFFGKEGFTFSRVDRSGDVPRSGGLSPNGIVNLSLRGPQSDLTRTTLIMGLDPYATDLNARYSLMLIGIVLPDWSDGFEWFQENTSKIYNDSDNKIEKKLDNAVVEMRLNISSQLLVIDITTR